MRQKQEEEEVEVEVEEEESEGKRKKKRVVTCVDTELSFTGRRLMDRWMDCD